MPASPKPKKGTAKRERRARKRAKAMATADVRPYVFRRERNRCRICGDLPNCRRAAVSRHENKSRGAGGPISPENCIAVCGSGTTGCHGFCQRYEITIRHALGFDHLMAEGTLMVTVKSKAAAAWLNVPVGYTFLSKPRYNPIIFEREDADNE